MIVAKWVIVAFLGFTAIFAGDLRAHTVPSKTPALDQLLASGKLSASMTEHVTAIAQTLGIDLDISSWVLNERKGDIERTLKALDSAVFYSSFPRLIEKCAIAVKKLNLSTTILTSSTDLNVDTFDPALLSKLSDLPAQCEKVANALQDANAEAAPRKVSIDIDDVFQGRFTGSVVAQWATALKTTKFLAALDDYSRECRNPVSDIRLGTYSTYSQGDKQQTFDTRDGVADATRRLTAAATACSKVIPALAQLNSKSSILDHGILFTIEGQDLYQRRFSATQVLNWIKYFESDAARIGQLKAEILKGSKSYDFSDLKQCQANPLKSPAACNKYVISVSFSTFDDILHAGVFSMFLFMFLGDPLIMPTLAIISAEVKGPPVYLNVNTAPHVPTNLK